MWKAYKYTNNRFRPRVLICDPEAHTRVALQEYLRSIGFYADQARNGFECIELAWHHHPDVILLDLEMPHMDGLAIMRQLRAMGINVPVLLFSAGSGTKPFDDDSAVLQKPFRLKEIAVVLETLLLETKKDKHFIPRRFKVH